MRFKALIATLTLLAAALRTAGHSAEYGTEHPVSIITEEKGSRMDIFFRNRSAGSLTVTLYFTRFINARANRPLPLTLTAPAGKITRALTVSQADPAKKWDTYFMYNYLFGSAEAVHRDDTLYHLPYRKGAAYTVVQGYDGRYTHKGEFRYSLDWGMPVGTEVLAAREGVVVEVVDRYDGHGLTNHYWDRNNLVSIEHPDGTVGRYVHFKKGGARVKAGQRVRAGDLIALSGNVGYSDTPHLHLSVYKPLDGKRMQSIPVRFRTAEGGVILTEGKTYRAP